jgi:hypothetical protein
MFYGFTRAADGTFTKFLPSSGAVPAVDTFADSVSAAGAVTGYYCSTFGVVLSFLRAAGGKIATFEAPGSGTADHQGTRAQSINEAGTIAGWFVDASNTAHGFLRIP